jgi:hypothetical protein
MMIRDIAIELAALSALALFVATLIVWAAIIRGLVI